MRLQSAPGRRRIPFGVFRGVAALLVALPLVRAEFQFDVFLGYGGQPTGTDGIVREAGWFPVGCEVFNDGPTFNAVFEVSTGQMGSGQTRSFQVELPTGTRKRFVIPAFAGAGIYSSWDVRLLDEQGRVRSEKTGLRPRGIVSEGTLLGAVPRTFGGLAKFPDLRGNNNRGPGQPSVARIPVELLPSDPIALEGLSALYLNSEKALELKENQAEALLDWVHGGGHLIVGVEQASDVNALPWLKLLLPLDMNRSVVVKPGGEIVDWVRSLQTADSSFPTPRVRGGQRSPALTGPPQTMPAFGPDPEFDDVEFSVATGRLRNGKVVLANGGVPLIVRGDRGRGKVTVLAFSPEREPFRSWKLREWFWVRLTEIPYAWFAGQPLQLYGGYSIDGVFGAMIDSRQVRKLPVQWLLLLLVVYLLVIGPVDQYVLKRLGRQMLTWLTFPAYVVLFSLLIYYIGYKLRAGETEWNELNVVDILPREGGAEWRGRTYASIYSPVNARYRVSGRQPFATLRSEFLNASSGGQSGSRVDLIQRDPGFEAEIFVPVWSSQLYVSDWVDSRDNVLEAALASRNGAMELTVFNRLGREIKDAKLVMQDQLYEIGAVPPGRTVFPLDAAKASGLGDLVIKRAAEFQNAALKRQHAFGDDQALRIELNASNLTAASFLSRATGEGVNHRAFVSPQGMDLTPWVRGGGAVLLAWDPGNSPLEPPLNQFKAIRSNRNSLFRLAIPAIPGA